MRGKLCGDPVNGLVPGMLSPNECNIESISEPDNVAYDAEQDTMYIYEDSGLHENNFLWAYQVCNALYCVLCSRLMLNSIVIAASFCCTNIAV